MELNQLSESSRSSRKYTVVLTAFVLFAGASVSLLSNNPSLRFHLKTVASDDVSTKKQETKPIMYDGLSIYPYMPDSSTHHHGTYDYVSPYELRFPNYKLTYGFRKTVPYNFNLPTHKQVCFVHVGKAGGSTIGCSLGFSLHCSDEGQVIPYSLLPVLTTHTFHRGVYDCQDDAAYFLFVVRDPLARIMSAFNYDRPQQDEELPAKQLFHKREFYLDCPFWTLEQVAKNGLLNSNGVTSKTCRRRAKSAIMGIEQYIPHWFFNYQYYYEFVPKNAKILVIRNEHIVDDYNSIEQLLGGNDGVLNSSLLPKNNVHGKNSADLYLGDDSKVALCRALCNEIQFYKKILRSAVNFIEEDVMISMEELKSSCPDEALSEACVEPIPNIAKKIRERKEC